MKHDNPVTWQQRKLASKIIHEARNRMGRKQVAAMFGLADAYISTAEKMNIKSTSEFGINYWCPAWAIRKIIEVGSGK